MDTVMLRGLVQQVESAPSSHQHLPAAPEPALSKPHTSASADGGFELDRLRAAVSPLRPTSSKGLAGGGGGGNGSDNGGLPTSLAVDTTAAAAATGTTVDLERSLPGSPAAAISFVEARPSLSDSAKNRHRYAGVCLMQFLGGLTDSSPGALIPYMERYYDIDYAVVSLLFVGNAFGFIAAAAAVDPLRARLGRARALCLGQACCVAGFALLSGGVPFPAVVAGFFLLGFGFAVCLAINQVFCANLRSGTTALGGIHAAYGLGGTLGPLIATAVASSGAVWTRYYLMNLGFAVFNAGFALWSFWGYESETSASSMAAPMTTTTTTTQQQQQDEEAEHNSTTKPSSSSLLTALRSRIVLLAAVYIFAYQGAEVSISGWVISFLIAARGGDPSSVGYVTSGFWAGITVGRLVLSPLGARWGEKLFCYVLVAGAAVFQLLVWFVPNIVGESVALAIVGLMLGPIYPCATTVFARNLSRGEQLSGMGVITAFGSSGGAVAPFTTGMLAQAAGTWVLHPIALGLFGLMAIVWFAQPTPRKTRSE